MNSSASGHPLALTGGLLPRAGYSYRAHVGDERVKQGVGFERQEESQSYALLYSCCEKAAYWKRTERTRQSFIPEIEHELRG